MQQNAIYENYYICGKSLDMDFTTLEKQAISRLLTALIKADGHVDIGEAESLYLISTRIGISTQIQSDAARLSKEDAIEIVKSMEGEKRVEVVRLLHDLADADGRLDPNEMELILKLIH